MDSSRVGRVFREMGVSYKHMNHKHSNHSGGFHIAQMIPYEVVGYGTIVLVTPRAGFLVALIFAVLALWVAYFVFSAIAYIAKHVPTALGYSDLAVQKSKNTAAKAKLEPKPRSIIA